MSFISALKNAFGLGSDYEQDPIEDTEDLAVQTVDESVTEKTTIERVVSDVPAPVIDPAIRDGIFDGVVRIFNSALPDFLRESVDTSRQSALIRESLDKSLQDYLDSLVNDATRYAENRLRAEATEAQKESERLRKEMETLEQQRSSIREQQLSADRRRRALADRVTDLEAQLASAEAEKEQYELEKRSLLNKIKVADVQPALVEEMSKEIERLKSEVSGNTASAEAKEEIERLKADLDALNGTLKQHKEQVGLGQAMYNDLQNKYADEHEARAKAEAELAEAKKIFDTVEQMQSQMQEVEVLIRKRDDRIAKLKSNNKRLKEDLAQAQAMIERQKVVDGGLFSMPDEKAEAAEAVIRESEAIPDLDDDFECPDWFVSEPAPGEPGLRADDSEFGYTEPPKKAPRPENDAQLSLF